MPLATIKANDRVLMAGQTGSGKTFLARYLTRGLKRLIVLDSKTTLYDWGLDDWDGEQRRKLREGEPVRARVLPGPDDFDSSDWWADVLADVYAAGDCTIYIDEIYGIVPPSTRAPNILPAIWTRGREFGIGVWSATQRPTWIPLFALSENQHFFCFRLLLFEDRKRMAAFMGEQVVDPITDEHGFFYSRASDRAPTYVSQLETGREEKRDVRISQQKITA